MEECLKIIRKECVFPKNFVNIPSILTKDNINDSVVSTTHNTMTLLEYVVFCTKNWNNTKRVLLFLLCLEATVSRRVFLHSFTATKFFLEQGIHPNSIQTDRHLLWCLSRQGVILNQERQQILLLIDYGICQKTGPSDIVFSDYYNLSNTRVATSRKSLCALLWCSRRGFIPLRGIILELAKQSWAQRGGEGCGPRGALWGQ